MQVIENSEWLSTLPREQNCVLLLNYKRILSNCNIKNTIFVEMEVFVIRM
jgi:hypothetical protein